MLYVKEEVNARLCGEHMRVAKEVWELFLEIHEQLQTCPGSDGWLCQQENVSFYNKELSYAKRKCAMLQVMDFLISDSLPLAHTKLH